MRSRADVERSPLRSHQVRCDSHALSLDRRSVRDTRCCHPAEARHIPSLIHPGISLRHERVGRKRSAVRSGRFRYRRPTPTPPIYTSPRRQSAPDEVTVQQIHLRVGDRTSDRDREPCHALQRYVIDATADNRFRRPVLVDQSRLRRELLPASDLLFCQRLTADDQRVRPSAQLICRELLSKQFRWAGVSLTSEKSCVPCNKLPSASHVRRFRQQDHLFSGEQRREQSGHRQVERHGDGTVPR